MKIRNIHSLMKYVKYKMYLLFRVLWYVLFLIRIKKSASNKVMYLHKCPHSNYQPPLEGITALGNYVCYAKRNHLYWEVSVNIFIKYKTNKM